MTPKRKQAHKHVLEYKTVKHDAESCAMFGHPCFMVHDHATYMIHTIHDHIMLHGRLGWVSLVGWMVRGLESNQFVQCVTMSGLPSEE